MALGATWVERHITWDRTMWGSDQSSSVEIPGLIKLVKGCNDTMAATKYPPGERRLFKGELSKMASLRPTPAPAPAPAHVPVEKGASDSEPAPKRLRS